MRDYLTDIKTLIEKKNSLKELIFSDVTPIEDVILDGIRCKKIPYNSRMTILDDPSDWEIFPAGGAG